MEELVAQRYANAILSNSDKSVVSNCAITLSVLSDALKSEKSFRNSLSSPLVSKERKVNMILDSIGKNVETILSNLIKVLGEKGRLNTIPSISKIINSELQKLDNKYQGIVKSVNELSKSDIKDLENKLSSYTNSTITLVQEKSNIDGMKVSVEDLGIEVNFSKERVKSDLIDFINRAI
jgi:F-type H+-transporting ATPase subunit delta